MINLKANTVLATRLPSQGKVQRPDLPQPPEEPKETSLLCKLGGSLVAVGAGSAGLVYGGAKGFVRGAQDFPGTVKMGAQIGARGVEPLTRTLGAVAAVALTGVTGVTFALGAVAAPLAGFVQATVQGAGSRGKLVESFARTSSELGVKGSSAVMGPLCGAFGALLGGVCTLPTILYPPVGLKLIPETVRSMAKNGFRVGTAMGGPNGPVGGMVGLIASGWGALAGVGAAVVLSTPQGCSKSLEAMRGVAAGARQLPRVTGELWQDCQSLGKGASHFIGGGLGGVVGGAVGVLETGGYAVVDGVSGAADWGRKGYRSVAGQPGDPAGS